MNDIESRFRRMTPNAGPLNRDALLYSAAFTAGRAAGRKPWIRLSAILALTIVALSFALVFWTRLPALPPHAIVPAEPPASAAPPQPETYHPEPMSYIALMQHLGEVRPMEAEGSTEEPPPPLTPRSRFE